MKRNEASAETRKESKAADEKRVMSVRPAKGKHRTLILDPPWDYEWLSLAGRASPGYATMSHEQLQALDRGVVVHLVQATLGHSSVATTGRYLHARPTESSSKYLAV